MSVGVKAVEREESAPGIIAACRVGVNGVISRTVCSKQLGMAEAGSEAPAMEAALRPDGAVLVPAGRPNNRANIRLMEKKVLENIRSLWSKKQPHLLAGGVRGVKVLCSHQDEMISVTDTIHP
jgi:hypothetical protein